MPITQLETWNYRNLENAAIAFSPKINLFVGNNGQGKTNLMEALYVACLTKSFRTHQLADCVTHGRNAFRVCCSVDDVPLDHRLEVRLTEEGKDLRADGKAASIADFLDIVSVLCITADHLRVITDGPDARRRFFDGLLALFRSDSLRALAAYRRVLRQKMSLLRTERLSVTTLEPWNRKLVREARTVVGQRREFMSRLAAELGRERFSGLPLDVEYQPSLAEDLLADEETALRHLQRQLPREKEAGRALLGPHLDRYQLFLDGRNVRRFASSGQRRSILLNVYLAVLNLFHREKGVYPVLMIDDVDMELDVERIHQLIRFLDFETQIFLTSSKAEIFKDILSPDRFFHVENGGINKS
ncbi:MAG: DNA replication and repair protein RecF [Acidobacteria bacterium]|nr:DNA replication and repair protein RecF [Acidobacteriota bacterium]